MEQKLEQIGKLQGVWLHTAHVLCMDAILSVGLEMGSHNPDCWPHVFRCAMGSPPCRPATCLPRGWGRGCCAEEVDFHACQHFSGAQSLSHVRLFATPWTVALQATLSMGFPKQECNSGCHAFLQGIFLAQGSNACLMHWQADSLPLSHQGRPCRL